MQEDVYSIHELKENPSFRRMAKGIATADEIESWNRWIESSDENRQKSKQALLEIVGFEFQLSEIPNVEREWIKLREKTTRIGKLIHSLHTIRRNKDNGLNWVFRAVAVILLTGFVGFGVYLFQVDSSSVSQLELFTTERTVTTNEGEQKTLKFTNGSKIILNSYSLLTYRLGNSNNSTIEITLDGEAWFEADPDSQSNQPVFAITTPDGIIRDIGTKFLVTVEKSHSRIVLDEGLVVVQPLSQTGSWSKEESFQVQKREMVEFRRTEIITRRYVNPTYYSSWATGILELDQSGFFEFAEYVEQRFHVNVQLRDSSLKNIQLNGTVYFRSLDELIRSVSEVTGIPVYRSEDRSTVYFGNL